MVHDFANHVFRLPEYYLCTLTVLIKYRDLHNLFRSGYKSLHKLEAYLDCWFSEISIARPRSSHLKQVDAPVISREKKKEKIQSLILFSNFIITKIFSPICVRKWFNWPIYQCAKIRRSPTHNFSLYLI